MDGSRGRVAVALAMAFALRAPQVDAQPSGGPTSPSGAAAVPTSSSKAAAGPASPPGAAAAAAAPASAPSMPAASADDSPERRAEARFQQASEAFDRGRVDEACLAFAESLRLVATLGTLLNLALCHEKQGKTATAWGEFTQAAAWAGDAKQWDRRDFAHQHVARLERSLSRIQLSLSSGAEPAAITIDGQPVAVTRVALPVFLDPGNHEIVATAAGRRDFVTTVSLRADADAQIVAIPPLEPLRIASPPAHDSAAAPQDRRPPLGWIVGGAGLVAIVTGVGFGVDALAKTGDLGPSCGNRCGHGPAQVAEAVSIASLSAGAAALAAGVWLVAAPRRSMPSALAHWAPRITPRGAGVDFTGSW